MSEIKIARDGILPPNRDYLLVLGDSSTWEGRADFVFTHPYAPFPRCVRGVPGVINLALPTLFARIRQRKVAEWCGAALRPIGSWAPTVRQPEGWNTLFAINAPVRQVVFPYGLQADPGGWFPETLCHAVFDAYADLLPAGAIVWDGFMGRGTVGRVALERGYRFVGIDNQEVRYRMAVQYLTKRRDLCRL